MWLYVLKSVLIIVIAGLAGIIAFKGFDVGLGWALTTSASVSRLLTEAENKAWAKFSAQ